MDDLIHQNIVKDLGLDGLSAEKQKEAFLEIGKIIFQAVLLRVLDVLSDADKEAFEKILAHHEKNEDAILAFLTEKVTNLDQIIKEEVARFKEESVNLMKNLEK